MAIDIPTLLAPISADAPCGEDAGFSDLFDRIREARRADDPTLSQGDWRTDLKVADWRSALDLSTQVLTRVSKDLQAAGWLAEAATARFGLEGTRDGLTVVAGLLEQYWDGLYPELDGEDADERAGKLVWLNTNLATALQTLPLNDDSAAPVTLHDWQSSREVDNLSRQNADAYRAALDEGRLNGEAFDAAVAASSADRLRERVVAVAGATAAFTRLQAQADVRMGRNAPVLTGIETALKRITQVLQRAAQQKGLLDLAPADTPAAVDDLPTPSAPARIAAVGTSTSSAGTIAVPSFSVSGDGAAAKQAALKALDEIAGFFRRTEPHSPVSSLLDQAVRWADISLADFLQEVVRDDSVLNAIRARVGLKQE
ncbi:MAG: type VI secretion system protein TssA [Pseudoxanthomonas sp.]|jgi:type VI secretion system protein ImpA